MLFESDKKALAEVYLNSVYLAGSIWFKDGDFGKSFFIRKKKANGEKRLFNLLLQSREIGLGLSFKLFVHSLAAIAAYKEATISS